MRFVLPPCPPVRTEDLPGMAQVRVIDGVTPSVTTLLAQEGEGRDNLIDPRFLDCLRTQPLVEFDWPQRAGPPHRFPRLHTDVSMVAAAFAVPLPELRPLLPQTARLKPARLTPWHGVLYVYACHHHRSGLGRYQELGVAVPMLLDRARAVPGWSLLRELLAVRQHPALGLYTLELAMDRQRPCEAGIRLHGLPGLVGHAEFALGSQTGLAGLELGGQRLAGLEVNAPRSYPQRVMDLSHHLFGIVDGRILRTRVSVLAEGYRGARGSAKVEFGGHPHFSRFAALKLLPRPLETRVCSRQNWIVGSPEDCGAA